MKKKIEIFCTLGPKSLNKSFLKNVGKKVNLLRLNMSHIEPKHLERLIKKDYQPTDDDNIEIVKSITSIDTVRNQNYKDYLEPMTVEWLEGLFKKYA